MTTLNSLSMAAQNHLSTHAFKKVFQVVVLSALAATTSGHAAAEVRPPTPIGGLPDPYQLGWHELEFYGFIHYSPNVFTDREWGDGSESPHVFNPTELDAGQWAEAAKNAGMTGLILTAKHHGGFCLWPSRYTEHSVKNSPWRNGQGDLVRELSQACRQRGLKFGFYLSPWDRNHPDYGRPEYVTYFRNQLRELLTGYGKVFEVWFDGANGGSGYYGGANETRRIDRRSYYDWENTWEMVRQLQPQAMMFSDGGPDIRWVGNEHGTGYEPNWATVNNTGFYPGIADLNILHHGNRNGRSWLPAECDVSLRQGWFFHPNQKPKSLDQLQSIYLDSVGRGCNLLLNLTPDRRGLVPESDVRRLAEFGQWLNAVFAHDQALGAAASASNVRGNHPAYAAQFLTDGDRRTYWAADDAKRSAELEVRFESPTSFQFIRLQEYIPRGQRVEEFAIDTRQGNEWKNVFHGETIGVRRIIRLPEPVETSALRVRILRSLASPTLSTIEVYGPGS